MSECISLEGQKMEFDPLELELQTDVKRLILVLGNKLKFSGRLTHSHGHEATSPALQEFVLRYSL